MFARVENFLNQDQLTRLEQIIAANKFVDGSATTGAPTKRYKHNLQLEFGSQGQRDELVAMVMQILNTNPLARIITLPKRITQPMINKYGPGMSYGWHIDNPLMGGVGGPVRSDMACTVFLSNPADYEGGELVARSSAGDVKIKMARGDAFIYPATTRHQVLDVTKGERLALIFWIQSMVADADKRNLLYQLDAAYAQILKDSPESEALQMIQQVQTNLMRSWVEV